MVSERGAHNSQSGEDKAPLIFIKNQTDMFYDLFFKKKVSNIKWLAQLSINTESQKLFYSCNMRLYTFVWLKNEGIIYDQMVQRIFSSVTR